MRIGQYLWQSAAPPHFECPQLVVVATPPFIKKKLGNFFQSKLNFDCLYRGLSVLGTSFVTLALNYLCTYISDHT